MTETIRLLNLKSLSIKNTFQPISKRLVVIANNGSAILVQLTCVQLTYVQETFVQVTFVQVTLVQAAVCSSDFCLRQVLSK